MNETNCLADSDVMSFSVDYYTGIPLQCAVCKLHSNAQTFIEQVTCTDGVCQETDISAESFEIHPTAKYKSGKT